MKILIQPFARLLRNGKQNPKNYPYWKDLIKQLEQKNHEVYQVGVTGEEMITKNILFDLNMKELVEKVKESDFFISIDSFLPHLAHFYNKSGIVIFSQSDPAIFGYPHNINLLRDKKFLRPNQFSNWEDCTYSEAAFISTFYVMKAVEKMEYSVKTNI